MDKLYNGISKLTKTVNYIGLFSIFFMMAITTIDVILRKTGTGYSVRGSYELTEMAMVLIVFLAIPTSQLTNGHIRISMLVDFLPGRARYFFESLVVLAEGVFICFMAIGAYQKCQSLSNVRTTTDVLRIPQLPFAVMMSVGLSLFAVVLVLNAVMLAISGIRYRKARE